ncbi:MAG TPA: pyrimidine dimer DNA glycosylase/endonuclease V [Spirochaetota bacterium]|nr:pyrimidine dimer DNA glycosylase/endonuclease V [Spirochaetota bacterium]HOM39187.1 pyrimidine dimer DNA glycosylase/endonuclease V [Spirochaetota bacterium]HPQ49222.1 pyrimidine dimer DNA glycosylase/endonuclease V [Spirochaetota bacterium]
MRLWSISPEYLDKSGLVALWREGLLAKAVLENKTRGYKNHPQLLRFKNYIEPLDAINSYLSYVFLEGERRNYRFDKSKIEFKLIQNIISISKGQIIYEFDHLLKKLRIRDTTLYNDLVNINLTKIKVNPIFFIVDGEIESWEKLKF